MTKLLVRLFVKNHNETASAAVRSAYGALAGTVGIIANILLCLSKLVIGVISASVAITADALNNLSDASSSIVTLLGFHLAQKPEDEEHPYGHARMEYLSSLAVAALILVIGLELGMESFKKIIHPEAVFFSPALVIVLVLSMGVKIWLALFNRSVGKMINSTALMATSADSRNDVIATGAVLLSSIVSHYTGLMLDGWIGFLVALFILWSGIGIAKETADLLLGGKADANLKKTVEREVFTFDERILGTHDLMVHDYGPGRKFASIHVEVDRNEDVMAIHNMIDNVERMMLDRHQVHLTIHYDPLVVDDPRINHMKERVLALLRSQDDRLTLHDFRMVEGPEHTNLIFDVVVPFDSKKTCEEIKASLDQALSRENTRYFTVITFDHDC